MESVPTQISVVSARLTIFKNPKFKTLRQNPDFKKRWFEFQQDIISWSHVDYHHFTTAIDLDTLEYMIDRWFKDDKQLNQVNQTLKYYFKHNTQKFSEEG